MGGACSGGGWLLGFMLFGLNEDGFGVNLGLGCVLDVFEDELAVVDRVCRWGKTLFELGGDIGRKI